MELILASGSRTRLALLRNAGLALRAEPSHVDEGSIKRALAEEGASAEQAALRLALAKAERVSKGNPGALVIGADQILELDGAWLDKPVDLADARSQLGRLRGRTHVLVSASVALLNGTRIWDCIDAARLTVRSFSDGFLDAYLAEAGASALESVGGYQLERVGAQLFERVEGDFFTVLGLPLLPLLGFLRSEGVLEA